jgi:hypothetical protein
MKRIILILLIFYSFHASAQNNLPLSKAFSPGFELGIPSNSIYNVGLGLSGKVEFPVSNRVCISATVGYSSFFYKSNLFKSSLTPSAASFAPLKAGVKYYFNQGVYVEGELGTAIETNYLKQDLFAFSIGPGFILPINDKRGIDIGFRYENWSNHQVRQTAIRVAYRLGW